MVGFFMASMSSLSAAADLLLEEVAGILKVFGT